MANEIKVGASLEVTNGNFKLPKAGTAIQQIDQSTPGGGVPGTVSIGTSEQDIILTEIGTFGWARIENTDATNFLTYGPKSAGVMVVFGRLRPGEAAVMRLEPGITLRMIANTAPVLAFIQVVED